MGQKKKVGKARRDKFYHLAKETGFRSRAAFKLLQLNRKFGFLAKSRVCIDLCAAPGGWMQVAAQNMPVSSIIIGVDLVPIRPIPNCSSLTEDITTEKCRQALRKQVPDWKADLVLHDGAPNVGQNWLFDAFQQAQLTLHAIRLAVDFLRRGGWFISKVFRSKDYQALVWVLQQLFQKVHATKPQASRNESAEIFLVCQGYLAPDKVDPKFTDPKYVFKELAADPDSGHKKALELIHPKTGRKAKAEGYDESNVLTVHSSLHVSEFLAAKDRQLDLLEMLSQASEIVLDDERVVKSALTTNEIKECCKDIKVLGRVEIKSLLKWRQKLKEEFERADKEESDSSEEEDKELNEEEKLNEMLVKLHEADRKTEKRKRREVMKEKRKLRDKMSLGMVIPGDKLDLADDVDLFDINKIKQKEFVLSRTRGQDLPDSSDDEDDFEELAPNAKKPNKPVVRLDPVELALGEELIKSKKRRLELEDASFHRFTFNDEHLPDWFMADERKHMKPNLPVTKEQIQEYKNQKKALDARPIKKVAEAKARKRRKTMKRMERAKKKAEAISEMADSTERDKMKMINQIYKRAESSKKRGVTYVVARKGGGKGRPAGVKGRYKAVDARLKKDSRAEKKAQKSGKGRQKGGKGRKTGGNSNRNNKKQRKG